MACRSFAGGPGASYNLSDVSFKIVFESNQSLYLIVPLLSLMRSSEIVPSQCDLLINFIDVTKSEGFNIVLGGAFFNSFFA